MSKSVIYLMILVLTFGVYWQETSAACRLDIRDLERKYAGYITEVAGYPWYPVENGKIRWEEGIKLKVNCVNQEDVGSYYSYVTCRNGIMIPEGILYCRHENEPVLSEVDASCDKSGTFKYINLLHDKNLAHSSFTICYNEQLASSVYSYHVITGSLFERKPDASEKIPFRKDGISHKVEGDCVYKRNYQFGAFAMQLESIEEAKKYIKSDSFLIPAQLYPSEDAYFPTWRKATFYYLNTAPQWKEINEGNWKVVNDLVREKARDLGDYLEVLTGVYGRLTLPNEFGGPVKLYLEPWGKYPLIPIPEWFWKVILHKNEQIIFLTLNNPFVNETKCPCGDDCGSKGLYRKSFSYIEKGFTCCCLTKLPLKNLELSRVFKKVRKFLHLIFDKESE